MKIENQPLISLPDIERANVRALEDAKMIEFLISEIKILHSDNVKLSIQFKQAQEILASHAAERLEQKTKEFIAETNQGD